jgi:uncharacterized protein Yka (UPF0111/DUF47 family)
MMDSILPLNSSAWGCSGLPADDNNYRSSQLVARAVFSRQDTDFTIVTSEGDRVTLSYDSEFEAACVTYDSLARVSGDSSGFHGEILGFHASREFSISVEGELNEQEVEDIKKAVKAVSKIMRDFLLGDIDHATERAVKIAKLESISSVEASLQFDQIVYLKRQSLVEMNATATEPETTAKSTGAPTIQEQIDNVSDEIAEVVKNSRIKPVNKLVKPIHELFTELFKEVFGAGFRNTQLLDIAKSIESKLLERIGHLSEEPEDKRPALKG